MSSKNTQRLNKRNNTRTNKRTNKGTTKRTFNLAPGNFAIYLNETEKIDPITTVDFSVLEKLLIKHNFKKANPARTTSIDCLITYIRMPSHMYRIKTILQNNMEDRVLAYKSALYNLSDQYDHNNTIQYFFQSEIIDKSKLETYQPLFEKKSKKNNKNNKDDKDDNYMWILKGDQSYGGSGNFIVSNYSDFRRIVNQYKFGFLLSKYLTKPLLFHRKKFHLRLYVINFIDNNNQIRVFFSKYGFMYTAKQEYINSNYDNKDIHDSHFKSTDTDYLFPNTFIDEYGMVNYRKVNSQIIEIIRYISEIQIGKIKKFEKIPFSYNILGYDFIISEDYQVKLLEINTKTGLYTKTPEIREFFSKYLLTNIYNNVISQAFNTPKEPIDEDFIMIV